MGIQLERKKKRKNERKGEWKNGWREGRRPEEEGKKGERER